ncbi:MAG: peptide ABC transporter substrate-binding protein [Myxococcota bacterium]
MTTRLWPCTWLLVAMLCSCKGGGGARVDGGAARGKVITVGMLQEPDSLWPLYKEMMASEEVLRAGQMTLALFNEKWEHIPHAAQAIPTVENGGVELLDGGARMRTTWKLRDDIFWPDGTPLTAEDFIFSWSVARDPRQEIADRMYVEKVEKMEALGPDKRTLVITWSQPFAYHANFRNFEPLPRHVVEPLYKEVGAGLKTHPYGRKPMLAGPFTVEDWQSGAFITLVRNPKATSPRWNPRVDRIIFKFITQSNTVEAQLVSGAVDAISPIGMQFDQAQEIERRRGNEFAFHYTDGLQWEHIDLNLDDPWLKDARMRRALAMGINRKALVDALFQGKQPLAEGAVPPRRYDYNPATQPVPYDPAKAAALLDEMGFQKGADGIREKDGKKLQLSIVTTAGNSTRERVEQIIQADLRKVGVDLVVENVPAKVFFGEITRRRKFKHMAMFAWSMDPLRNDENLWRCDYVPSEKNGWQGQNYGGWCNEEATKLLKEASRELDVEKRKGILHRVQELWSADLPAIPLYFRSDVSITRKNFRNWKPTGTQVPTTWNAHEWYLE